jgi:hypothetical protein
MIHLLTRFADSNIYVSILLFEPSKQALTSRLAGKSALKKGLSLEQFDATVIH